MAAPLSPTGSDACRDRCGPVTEDSVKPGERERPFLGSLAALADGEVGACIREAASRAKLHSRERPVVSGRPDADGLARSGKWTPSLGIFQTYREHRSHVVEVLDLTLEGDGIWLTWKD